MLDTLDGPKFSIEDGQARYVQTEYLQDIHHLLKSKLTELVRWEVNNFKTKRTSAHNTLAQSKDEQQRRIAQLFLAHSPSEVWASGMQIVGPRHLPRGVTTALYMILSGGQKRWIAGYFQVYTDLDGRWELNGYVSNLGYFSAFGNEIIEPQQDDLAQITGRRGGGLLAQLEQAFDGYLRFSEQEMGLSSTRSVAPAAPVAGRPQRSDDTSTFEERVKDKAVGAVTRTEKTTVTTSFDSLNAVKQDVAGGYDVQSVKTALERHQPVPGWYQELSSSTLPMSRDLHRKFLEMATQIYPQVLQRTNDAVQIWRYFERQAVAKGFAHDRCKVLAKTIELNGNNTCKLFGVCDKGKPSAHTESMCYSQHMRPGAGD